MQRPVSSVRMRRNPIMRSVVREATSINDLHGFVAAADFMHRAHVPLQVVLRVLAASKGCATLPAENRRFATAEELSDLIAVQMVYFKGCACVSAPSVRQCPIDAHGCNWEASDWQEETLANGPCRTALLEAIACLKSTYQLVSQNQSPRASTNDSNF